MICASESSSLFEFDSSASSFDGTTIEGYELSVTGRIRQMNYLPNLPSEQMGTWIAFRLDKLSVQTVQESQIQSVRFGITNFKFIGTAAFREKNQFTLALPLKLESRDRLINLHIRPVGKYEKTMQKVQTLKDIDVTCEAITNASSSDEARQLEEVIDSLCRILSVARGTKVQWIYCDYYDGASRRVRRTHFNHITAPFCPLAIIDSGIEGRNETQTFIEGAYRVYVDRRVDYELDRGIIDAYLNAKAENDYLEMRGAKLAVALEKLKAVFLKQGTLASEFILDEKMFDENIRPKIKDAIKDAVNKALGDTDASKEARSKIYEKLGELNRRSFKDLLNIFLNDVEFKASEEDLKLFIQCRNKLVHTGDFYCNTATSKEKSRCKPLPSPAEEYYFMVNFLDKIFLRLLGYSGQYVDWRTVVPGPRGKGVI